MRRVHLLVLLAGGLLSIPIASADVVIPPGKVEVEVGSESKLKITEGVNVRIKIKVKYADGTVKDYEVTAEKLKELDLKDGEKVKVSVDVLSKLTIGSPSGTPPKKAGAVGQVKYQGAYNPDSFIALKLPSDPPEEIRLSLSGEIMGEFPGTKFADSTSIEIPPSHKPTLALTAPSVKFADGKAETGPVKVTLDPDAPIRGTVNFDARTFEADVPIVIDMANIRVDDGTPQGAPLRLTETVKGSFKITPDPKEEPVEEQPPKTEPKKKTCGDCGVGSGSGLGGAALALPLLFLIAARRRSRRR